MRAYRTVLEMKIKERRQTLAEFAEYAEVFARENRQSGTLSVRHLQRLIAGHGGKGESLGPLRPATARLLECIFDRSIDELLAPPDVSKPATTARAGVALQPYFEWLDERAGWVAGTSRADVEAGLARISSGEVSGRCARRTRVKRRAIVSLLAAYYADQVSGYGSYRARCDGREVATTILSRPDWVDLACPLSPAHDRLRLVHRSPESACIEGAAGSAVERLVQAAALDVRLSNAPLYRLLEVDIRPGAISGGVCLVPFPEYALTMDLLEGETADAIVAEHMSPWGRLPLRDRYLPDLSSVVNLSDRLCAGGVLALCAIARPIDPHRGERDYALVIQKRSAHVLNATQKLAVIPKGFHEPLNDVRGDTRIGATLRREMEEELFGRSEVDSTVGECRVVAPMHPSRLSEPMRWLTSDPARKRMECTGFGLNLVSGNYEFASLIVIEDEEFWAWYGGAVEANWESDGLSLYSSRDPDLIRELIRDDSWSNEGLFALLQGLRRLRDLGGERVNLPEIEWTLSS